MAQKSASISFFYIIKYQKFEEGYKQILFLL